MTEKKNSGYKSKKDLLNTSNKKKKTRARSKEKKEKKFERILNKGIELYCQNKFSLQKLADHMDMSMPNLYHYVESKRELWIAIRKKYFKELKDMLKQTIENHNGNYLELFIKLSSNFLEFSVADYRRFDFMFLIPIPYSEKVGPLEKSYKPFNLLIIIKEVIKNAIEAGEIKEKDANGLTFFFYQLILGTAIAERNIVQVKDEASEPVRLGSNPINIQENRTFFLKLLRKILILLSL